MRILWTKNSISRYTLDVEEELKKGVLEEISDNGIVKFGFLSEENKKIG